MKSHNFVTTSVFEHFFTAVLDSKGAEVSREYKFSRPVEKCDCGCKQTQHGKSVKMDYSEGKVVIFGITCI